MLRHLFRAVSGERKLKTEIIDTVPMGAPGLVARIERTSDEPGHVHVRLISRWLNRAEPMTPDQAQQLAVALMAAATACRMNQEVYQS